MCWAGWLAPNTTLTSAGASSRRCAISGGWTGLGTCSSGAGGCTAGNRALAQTAALVWLSEETLTVEAQAEPLAYYTVKVNRRGELTAITEPRLLPTPYQAQQARLWPWAPNSAEWLLAVRVPSRRRRRRRHEPEGVQAWLTEPPAMGEVS